MLKGIPSILSPELLKILMEMGHGDTICIGDGNFPHASMSEGHKLVRLDGHGVPEILDAIMTLFPLDTYVEAPVGVMQPVDPNEPEPPIWKEYREIIEKHDPGMKWQLIERFAFYDEARKCYAVVSSGESALYANIILKKGVIK